MISRHCVTLIATASTLLLAGCSSGSSLTPSAGYANPKPIFDMSRMEVAQAARPPAPKAVKGALPARTQKAAEALCVGGACGVPQAHSFFENALPPIGMVQPSTRESRSEQRARIPTLFERPEPKLEGTRGVLTPASGAFDLSKLGSRSLYGRAWKRDRDLSAVSIGIAKTLRSGARVGAEVAVDPFASDGQEQAVLALELSRRF